MEKIKSRIKTCNGLADRHYAYFMKETGREIVSQEFD